MGPFPLEVFYDFKTRLRPCCSGLWSTWVLKTFKDAPLFREHTDWIVPRWDPWKDLLIFTNRLCYSEEVISSPAKNTGGRTAQHGQPKEETQKWVSAYHLKYNAEKKEKENLNTLQTDSYHWRRLLDGASLILKSTPIQTNKAFHPSFCRRASVCT